jgi:hypothetical protein
MSNLVFEYRRLISPGPVIHRKSAHLLLRGDISSHIQWLYHHDSFIRISFVITVYKSHEVEIDIRIEKTLRGTFYSHAFLTRIVELRVKLSL